MFDINLITKNLKLIGMFSLIAAISILFIMLKLKNKDNIILNNLIDKKDILLKEREEIIKNQNKNIENEKNIFKQTRIEDEKNNKSKKEIIKDIDNLKDNQEMEITI